MTTSLWRMIVTPISLILSAFAAYTIMIILMEVVDQGHEVIHNIKERKGDK